MNKKKVLLIIISFLIILLVTFLGLTIRKMIIINNIQNKVAKYLNSDNFYERITTNYGQTKTVTNSYTKGNKSRLELTSIAEDGKENKLINCFENDKANTYIESNGKKIAILDSNGIPSKITIVDPFPYKDDLWNIFLLSISNSIRSEKFNNKECYVVKLGKHSETYIEKETGLIIKSINRY